MGTIGDKPPHQTKLMVTSLYKKTLMKKWLVKRRPSECPKHKYYTGKKIMKSGKLLGEGGAGLIFTQRFGNVDI